MVNPLRFLGHQAAHKFLNVGLGWSLLRDRRVPVSLKATAFGLAVATTAALLILQVPLELLVAILLPFVGAVADTVIDGAEIVLLPILLTAAFLPMVARRFLVPQTVEVRN